MRSGQMSAIREHNLFVEMSKELLSNLGYNIVKEEHQIEEKLDTVGMCIKFNSDIFLRPKFTPDGLSFVECTSRDVTEKMIEQLVGSTMIANKKENYTKRIGGKIKGGILINNISGRSIRKNVLKSASAKNFFWWDIHRIFFYAMKVFSHSILENWVSQSKLGFVLTEQEIRKQFEPEHYFTSSIRALRFNELNSKFELYFSYFVDCLKDPFELSKGINSLHSEQIKLILDDVYNRLEIITKDYFPNDKKHITIEIHSLAGFTHDAEFKVKHYAQDHKDWDKIGVEKITIDEHTLFKYAIIPWEAVMDYAFTKRTGKHTCVYYDIPKKIVAIEQNFSDEFKNAIQNGEMKEPFTNQDFQPQENRTVLSSKTLYYAEVKNSPIKQRMLLFSRTNLPCHDTDCIEEIIKELKKDVGFNYTWVGILSGSGFSQSSFNFVNNFREHGIGLGFIDAVTKKLTVNVKTPEGQKINAMFLTECVS